MLVRHCQYFRECQPDRNFFKYCTSSIDIIAISVILLTSTVFINDIFCNNTSSSYIINGLTQKVDKNFYLINFILYIYFN